MIERATAFAATFEALGCPYQHELTGIVRLGVDVTHDPSLIHGVRLPPRALDNTHQATGLLSDPDRSSSAQIGCPIIAGATRTQLARAHHRERNRLPARERYRDGWSGQNNCRLVSLIAG